jgi:hypothetical protein
MQFQSLVPYGKYVKGGISIVIDFDNGTTILGSGILLRSTFTIHGVVFNQCPLSHLA